MNNDIDKIIYEVNALYLENPNKVEYDVDELLDENIVDNKYKLYLSFIFLMLCIVGGLFIPKDEFVLDLSRIIYYIGVCFIYVNLQLIFATFSNIKDKYISLAWGNVLGYSMIFLSTLINLNLKPYLSDNATKLLLYLIITFIIPVIATIVEILFLEKVKSNFKLYMLILVLYFIPIVMVIALPKLLPYLI